MPGPAKPAAQRLAPCTPPVSLARDCSTTGLSLAPLRLGCGAQVWLESCKNSFSALTSEKQVRVRAAPPRLACPPPSLVMCLRVPALTKRMLVCALERPNGGLLDTSIVRLRGMTDLARLGGKERSLHSPLHPTVCGVLARGIDKASASRYRESKEMASSSTVAVTMAVHAWGVPERLQCPVLSLCCLPYPRLACCGSAWW